MRKNILKIYGVILAIAIPYAVFVELTGWGIPCMVFKITGFQCPGCGITRMFTSILHLDFLQAFRYNQVMFVSFWVWNAIAILAFAGKPVVFRNGKFLYIAFAITVLSWMIFGLVRNLS